MAINVNQIYFNDSNKIVFEPSTSKINLKPIEITKIIDVLVVGGGGAGQNGRNGSKGIVIIRYLTSDFGNCTGGTKTTDGSYTIHTFTEN